MILLFVIGCLSYEEGQAERGALNCELADVCGELATFGFADADECKTASAAQPYDAEDCEDYDAGSMAACLDAYDAAIKAKDCEADFTDACNVCGAG